MKNLVEKFTPQADVVAEDDGVVAIEYVLIAGFVFIGVGVVFSTTSLWTDLKAELDAII